MAGACVPQIQCLRDFLATPSCGLLPINDANDCGAGPTVERLRDTITGGTRTSNRINFDLPVTLSPGDAIRYEAVVTAPGACCGGTIVDSSLRTPTDVVYVSDNVIAPRSSSDFVNIGASFSPMACAQFSQHVLALSVNTIADWSVTRVVTRTPNFNLGGTSPSTAPLLRTDPNTGRVCARVCGDTRRFCSGDDRQYHQLTLPPRSVAYIEAGYRALGRDAICGLTLVRPDGVAVCDLQSELVTTTELYRSRVVNNSDTARTLVLSPGCTLYGGRWNLAVGVDPLP